MKIPIKELYQTYLCHKSF